MSAGGNGGTRTTGWLLLAPVLLAVACTGAVDAKNASGNNRDPGSPGGGGTSNPGGGPGPGGGNSPGAGSPSPPGTTAPPPTPVPDGGAPTNPPGAGMGPGLGCRVDVVPVAPPRLLDLLAGPDAKLRLQATVSGTQAPAQPTWTWTVMLEDTVPIETTKVTPAGDAVEVPLRSPGRYHIEVAVGAGCTPGAANATAASPSTRMTSYWVRVTPPRLKGLPTQEATIQLGGNSQPAKNIALWRGDEVKIDPKTPGGIAIPSFIRISSISSTVRFEGNNDGRAFFADLNPFYSYDVLVVPSNGQAPALIRGLNSALLRAESFMFDPGVSVAGSVRAGAAPGTPVTNARVLLRAGALPSTIGVTGADGRFELRARTDRFEAIVLPPADSGLPEARLPAGESLQVGSARLGIGFRWTQPTGAPLTVAAVNADGQAIAMARVRIEAEPGTLTDVGVFELEQVEGMRTLSAVGALRLERITDAGGLARFPVVPAGRYKATVAPAAGATNVAPAQTSITAGTTTAQRVTLPKPVTLRGQLLPATLSAGTLVLATDDANMAPGEALTATVDASGQFSFLVAPSRSYRLQVEPAQERKLPRLFLGPTTVGTSDTVRPPVTLSEGVTFVGTVTVDGGTVADAVIQLFCTGRPPDCVDPALPQLEAARPLAETKTAADGRFQVHLPDPARWDL